MKKIIMFCLTVYALSSNGYAVIDFEAIMTREASFKKADAYEVFLTEINEMSQAVNRRILEAEAMTKDIQSAIAHVEARKAYILSQTTGVKTLKAIVDTGYASNDGTLVLEDTSLSLGVDTYNDSCDALRSED